MGGALVCVVHAVAAGEHEAHDRRLLVDPEQLAPEHGEFGALHVVVQLEARQTDRRDDQPEQLEQLRPATLRPSRISVWTWCTLHAYAAVPLMQERAATSEERTYAISRWRR